MGLILKIIVYACCALIVVITGTFVVMEAQGRVEEYKKRIPWLGSYLGKPGAAAHLLLVAIFLLIGVGYELSEKEVPEVPSPPIIKTPPPPVFQAPNLEPLNKTRSAQRGVGAQRTLKSDFQLFILLNEDFSTERLRKEAELRRAGLWEQRQASFESDTKKLYQEKFAVQIKRIAAGLDEQRLHDQAEYVGQLLKNTESENSPLDLGDLEENVIPKLTQILALAVR